MFGGRIKAFARSRLQAALDFDRVSEQALFDLDLPGAWRARLETLDAEFKAIRAVSDTPAQGRADLVAKARIIMDYARAENSDGRPHGRFVATLALSTASGEFADGD